mmetsp:Transcript_41919/g.64158  ORF Transcript_41919/g.64158 Transcript_41919/m.64158 type:complete len:113 (+) Transcript_41919:1560-1898(+)
MKLCELLTMINDKMGEFVPVSVYLLHILEHNKKFLTRKAKHQLEDKMIPETLISIKVSKKHLDTVELRDRVFQEVIEAITIFYAANSRSLSFPEMQVSAQQFLRKLKKSAQS